MQTRTFEFRGMPVHCVELGDPRGPAVLMLHGSGAGASTMGNWRKVLEPLAAAGLHVHAMDLIGFGGSGRKLAPPYFDLELWTAQCEALLNRIAAERVGLIGHSLSGAIALKLASRHARISRVLTTATMGLAFPANDTTRAAWVCPSDMRELRATAQALIADPALIDEDYLAQRASQLFSGDYRDYYREMFSSDRQRYIDDAALRPEEIEAIQCDVVLMHGLDDAAFPAELLSLELARKLKRADAILLSHCSHSVAFEQPDKFVRYAAQFFGVESGHGQ